MWLHRAALQGIRGHANIATTMKYARHTQNLVKREVDRVGMAREGA